LTIWGWGALLTAAAMATGLALVSLVVLPGVPLGLLVILLVGVPSSPVPVQPWNFAPGAYRVLGPYDPVGAAVNGMRNGLYFDGAPLTRNRCCVHPRNWSTWRPNGRTPSPPPSGSSCLQKATNPKEGAPVRTRLRFETSTGRTRTKREARCNDG
jgi:hypothetical protein